MVALCSHGQSFDWGIVSEQGGRQSGNSIAVDSSRQCIYVVGHHDQDFDLIFESDGTPPVYSGNSIIPHIGSEDGFLMKFSFEGELLWYNYFTGGAEQVPTGVDVDYNGNVYVTGYFKNHLICRSEDGENLFSYVGIDSGNSNLFVASFDDNGELLWSDQQGGQQDDFAMDISVDGDGAYVIGVFRNDNTTLHGYDIPDALNTGDIFVLKYGLDGSYEWFSVVGTSGDDYVNSLDVRESSLSITAYNDRVYFIGTWSENTLWFFENEMQLRNDLNLNSSDDDQDYFVAAMSAEGEYLWTRYLLQEENGGYGYGIAADCNGVYVGLTVAFNGSNVIYPNGTSDFAFSDNIVLMKLDPSTGLNQWENVYSTSGDNDDDVLRSLAVDGHGGLYATGWFDTGFQAGLFGLFSYEPVDKKDVFMLKVNTSNGNDQWIRRLGDDEDDQAFDIAVAGENDIFVTGMTSGEMGNSPFAESSFSGTHNDNFLLFRMSDDQVNPRVCCNLSLNSNATDLSCFESNDGEISITPSGALGTVNFDWPTGTDSGGGNASNLSAGTYTVNATDGAGCQASLDVVVSQPDEIVFDDLSITNASCPDASDGQVEFRAYDYSGGGSIQVFDLPIVSAPAMSNTTVADTVFSTLSNLIVGDYEVYFEDDAGCSSDTLEVSILGVDTIAPTLDCTTDTLTYYVDGSCDFTPSPAVWFADLNPVDNCSSTFSYNSTILNPGGVWTENIRDVLLEVEDEYGNLATCEIHFEVLDTIAPNITCISDQTLSLDSSCDVSLPDYTGMGSYSDGCPNVTIDQSPASGTMLSGNGTVQEVTMTATDESGNSSSCTFDVVLEDNIDPVITCPGDLSEATDSNCDFSIPDYTGLATTSDNCDISVDVTQSPAVGTTISGEGTTQIITLTAEDDAGNTSNCTFTVTLIDDIAPTITCPADFNEATDAACNFVIPDYTGLATTGDNCDSSVEVTQTPAVNDLISGAGTTQVITLTAEDNAGNTTSCSFEITLVDDIDPVISGPSDMNEATDSNCDFSIPDYTSLATTSDNCGSPVVVTQSPVVGTVISGRGTTQTITLTAEDNAGNTSQTSFVVTLIDNIDPTITDPADRNEYLDADCDFSIPDYTSLVTTSDNCDGDVEVTQNPAVGTVYSGHLTTQTITLTATDDAGNSTQTSFEITLIDNIDPTITTPADQNESTDGSCAFEIPDYTTLVTTSDNCDTDVEVTQDPEQGDIVSGENSTHTITLTAEDDAGNSTSTSFEITLIDDIDPTITSTSDKTESLDSNCDFSIPDYTGFVTAEDNCDSDVLVTQSPSVGAVFSGHGTTQSITLTATDNAGNTAETNFVITLVDEIDPTITCPATQTYSLDANCEFTVPDFISMATFSDNCDADLDVVQNPALGDIITEGDGTYTVTLTATDDALNVDSCSFDLILVDDLAPTFTCPGDDVLNLTDSCSTSLPDYITEMMEAGSFEDNCGIQNVTQTPLAGTEISSTTTVTIEATDINGNDTSCNFEVTLEDVESPQFETCPADTISIDLANQCDYVLEDFTTQVGATDNCAVVDLVQSPAPGAITLQGNSSQSVTVTATDDAGNFSICSFVVTSFDDTAPVITDYPSDQTFDKDENCGFTLPDFTGNLTYDEPCTAVVTQSPEANEFLTADSTEVTLTVTDPYGNSSENSFYVYLEDTEAPTLTCNDLTIEVASCPIALPNFADSMLIEDNCEIASIMQSPEVGDFVMPGEHEITLTATDSSGNSNTCTFFVTYEDLTAPEIVCPDDIVESASSGQCGKVVTFDDPVDSDNCDVDNVEQIQGLSSGSFFEVGETLIEYEVTDFSGNTNTCSFTITVTDDEAPELTCPDDIVQCEQTVTFDAPMAEDNCEISTFDQTSSTIFQSGDTFPIGITTLEYTAEDIHGNISTCSFTVEVEEPIDTELPDFPEGFCPEGLPADISTYVDSELNWTWVEGTDAEGVFNENESGVYNLNFTAEIGTCFEEFNRDLEVYPAAVADAGPDLENCGDMQEVNATTSGSQINWTISSPSVEANPSGLVEDPMLIANEFGSYNLTLDVVTENGCTAQDQMSVAFYEMPGEPDAGEDFDFDFRYEVQLEGNYSGAGDISWERIAGQGTISNDNSPTPLVANLSEGTNIFEMSVSNGVCPTTRDSVIVIVNGLNIPTGFSPNGDNKNDRYVIRGIENATTSEFRVFNRWGSLVYEVENYNNDWEGQSKGGNPLPEDTYFYVLEINESLSFQGYIVIRR